MPKKKAKPYPRYFTGFEGKPGTDSYKANFSVTKPKKIETPLGGESDSASPFAGTELRS